MTHSNQYKHETPPHKNRLSYAGIGARITPENIQQIMHKVAKFMETQNWVLRSGAADGADKAFESGVRNDHNKEIFLPWGRFNGSSSPFTQSLPEAFDVAQNHIVYWSQLSEGAKKLHARNAHQIMGRFLDDPVKVVICWTGRGQTIGGTASAIKIARSLNIPVLNLGSLELKEFTEQLGNIIDVYKPI